MLLYILNEVGTCTYKVGFTKSKNAKHRSKTLNTGNQNGIVIIWEFQHDKANKIEGMVHRHYSWCRKNGEWFDFTNVKIDEVKEKIKMFAEHLKVIKL